MKKRSLWSITGLPEGFALLLLTISLVMSLAPVFAGIDLGPIKFPELLVSKYVWAGFGPLLLLLVISCHIIKIEERPNLMKGETQPVEKKVSQILSSMNSEEASVIQASIQKYKMDIREAQGRFFPFSPQLVEGGVFKNKDGAIQVSSFLIDPVPVTNQEFERFLADPKNKQWRQKAVLEIYGIPYYLCEFKGLKASPTKWDHPVVWVSWFAAAALCNWRSEIQGLDPFYQFKDRDVVPIVTSKGWRLPTSEEWDVAAMTCSSHEDPRLANFDHFYDDTTPVCRFPANRFGIWDLQGNVKEWMHDSVEGNRQLSDWERTCADDHKVFRGASWMDQIGNKSFLALGHLPAKNTNPDFGFRCVRGVT